MSRIGKQPIVLKDAKVNLNGKRIEVVGKKGKLEHIIPDSIGIELSDAQAVVTCADGSRRTRELHGLTRSLIFNMVHGVQTGFSKNLEIQGVGYRAQVKGTTLVLNLGYSHPVEFPIPAGVEIIVADNTKITVNGIDKQRVGQVAATIRQFRKPEPYKGKGIRYEGEYIMMKEGKTV